MTRDCHWPIMSQKLCRCKKGTNIDPRAARLTDKDHANATFQLGSSENSTAAFRTHFRPPKKVAGKIFYR